MKTILVDDELWTMDQFRQECSDLKEIELVGEFTDSEEALEYARMHLVEFALLDVEMPGMDGIMLAKELRKLYPDVIIVFVTGFRQYLYDFIDMKADYYVLKPYTKKEVEDVILRARLLSGRFKPIVEIRTFGCFEVLVNGKPLDFYGDKAKELMALYVDGNGATVTPEKASILIWDKDYDKGKTSICRMTIKKLTEILEQAGIGEILCSNSRGKYIDKSKVDCDYYRFLDGDEDAYLQFNEDYMPDYSWGENTLGKLTQKRNRYKEELKYRRSNNE